MNNEITDEVLQIIMNNENMEEALQIASQCWCDPETSHIVMNPALANAFAKRLASKMEEIDKLKRQLTELNKQLVNDLNKQLYERERESKKKDPNIRIGDWVSFYRAVAPGGYVTNAIIARVISISECPYDRGTKIYNTDQGPVGEKHILQSTRLSDD